MGDAQRPRPRWSAVNGGPQTCASAPYPSADTGGAVRGYGWREKANGAALRPGLSGWGAALAVFGLGFLRRDAETVAAGGLDGPRGGLQCEQLLRGHRFGFGFRRLFRQRHGGRRQLGRRRGLFGLGLG